MFGRGMSIPRRGFPNAGLDSPSNNSNSFWSIMGTTERAGISSSVGSVNMLDSDSGASSSDDDELMDPDEDPIVMTPQAQRAPHLPTQTSATNPFGSVYASPGGDWMGNYSPAAASLMRFQRTRRLRHGRSRKSSSSGTASGSSAIPSPSPGSPPIKTIEGGSGYFAKELARKGVESRRESISLGTKELHLSSGGESDEGGMRATRDAPGSGSPAVTPGKDEKRGVIRRPVTRRGSLLPKTKSFARIRAVLMEEATPVDTEVRREAEVIRQVREGDIDPEPTYHISQPTTGDSSPSLLPTVPGIEDMPGREATGNDSSGGTSESGPPGSFSRQAMRHSGGKEFWNSFDNRMHTPPPPTFPRGGSAAVSDDMALDSPALSSPPLAPPFPIQTGTHEGQPPSLMTEIPRKLKRRRDDDLEPTSLKRRAVSPGVSVHNSPILSQSPAGKDGAWWGLPKGNREIPPGGAPHGERNGNGNNGGPGTKRFGFQGMSDTNDGLMKMSIE
ncbi:hypothetical protein FGG08_000660 [Glutinoglossum americanum]|uniref:Uncharacterized protein n=1 Tax=Glutinoglossum americanum TaxID=1670608 RepID=A0A9P8I3D1_9PEZI|nr:hypothetical protein FGG08_000660 [Glutinoglossum americanum]